MNKTSIEWTDFTINPIRFRNIETGKVGHYCEKVSPGCKNCYASTMQKGPYLSGLKYIATNKDKGELYLDEAVLQQVLRRKKPARIFPCDMTDMFADFVPDEWIDRIFATMALTPQHTYQILTKRADRMAGYLSQCAMPEYGPDAYLFDGAQSRVFGRMVEMLPSLDARFLNRLSAFLDERYDGDGFMRRWPLPNAWLGVSVEDRLRKDRIDWLRKTPAAVRFLSCEPLLEDLGTLDLTGISWVIVGGESGPGARPMDEAWVRSIRDQCVSAGVAFFYKQRIDGGRKVELPMLDGRQWMEFPEASL